MEVDKRTTCLILVAFAISALVSSCPKDEGQAGAETVDAPFDLTEPVEQRKAESPPLPGGEISREELFVQRCGQCHEPEKGIGKYVGEQWKPVITRMMRKPGAFLNSSIAREIYFYLYERTSGEKSPEEEEQEKAPHSGAGMEHFGE